MTTNKNYLGVMIDCSRNAVMNVQSIQRFISLLSKMGYNMLQLYTEDTYEVNGEPYFGYLRGRYTKEQLKKINQYAAGKGIELVPCVQTLAHLNAITRWDVYKDIVDCNDIVLADEEKTYLLIDNMFSTLRECFTTDLVNIGMDEAHMVGLGKYLDKFGFCNRFDIMQRHLNRVNNIAKKHGFKAMMWSDMFFRLATNGDYYVDKIEFSETIKNQVPDDIDLVYWDYYSKDEKHYENMIFNHKQFKNPIWFAGGVWTWVGFTPVNKFSIEATAAAVSACHKMDINNMLFTMWGDNGGECSYFSGLPSLLYAAERYRGNTDLNSIKIKFKTITGIDWDEFLMIDNANDIGKENREFENPAKYMLYNDLLLGIFDSTVVPEEKGKLLSYSKQLDTIIENVEFGYLFKTQKSLLDVLAIKYDLGIRIHNAYNKRDMGELRFIVDDCDRLIECVEQFYKDFQNQWDIDNKPNGFDIQDIRIGGLLQRIKHCKDKINKFISGELTTIDELEETMLDYFGDGLDFRKQSIAFNNYSQTVSVNIL